MLFFRRPGSLILGENLLSAGPPFILREYKEKQMLQLPVRIHLSFPQNLGNSWEEQNSSKTLA